MEHPTFQRTKKKHIIFKKSKQKILSKTSERAGLIVLQCFVFKKFLDFDKWNSNLSKQTLRKTLTLRFNPTSSSLRPAPGELGGFSSTKTRALERLRKTSPISATFKVLGMDFLLLVFSFFCYLPWNHMKYKLILSHSHLAFCLVFTSFHPLPLTCRTQTSTWRLLPQVGAVVGTWKVIKLKPIPTSYLITSHNNQSKKHLR